MKKCLVLRYKVLKNIPCTSILIYATRILFYMYILSIGSNSTYFLDVSLCLISDFLLLTFLHSKHSQTIPTDTVSKYSRHIAVFIFFDWKKFIIYHHPNSGLVQYGWFIDIGQMRGKHNGQSCLFKTIWVNVIRLRPN